MALEPERQKNSKSILLLQCFLLLVSFLCSSLVQLPIIRHFLHVPFSSPPPKSIHHSLTLESERLQRYTRDVDWIVRTSFSSSPRNQWEERIVMQAPAGTIHRTFYSTPSEPSYNSFQRTSSWSPKEQAQLQKCEEMAKAMYVMLSCVFLSSYLFGPIPFSISLSLSFVPARTHSRRVSLFMKQESISTSRILPQVL